MRIGQAAAAATVIGCAAGAAFLVRSAQAADVRLVTSIATTGRTALDAGELVEFTVTVRSFGGSVSGVGFDARIGPAAAWLTAPRNCRPLDRGARLRCELGDVSGRTDLDLIAHVRHPAGPAAPPLLVTVTTTYGASPSVPATTRPRPGSPEPVPSASASPSGSASRSSSGPPSGAGSLPTSLPTSQATAPRPAPSRLIVISPSTVPHPSGPSWHQRRQRQPLVAPEPPVAPVNPGIPNQIQPSDAPSPDPSDLSLMLPSVTGTPPPGATELQANKDLSSIDPPQLSIVRADPVAGSRRAWVTVLGITIVFETTVLWLAACLSLWRRRATLTQAATGGLACRLRPVPRALWTRLVRLPRALDGLRRRLDHFR